MPSHLPPLELLAQVLSHQLLDDRFQRGGWLIGLQQRQGHGLHIGQRNQASRRGSRCQQDLPVLQNANQASDLRLIATWVWHGVLLPPSSMQKTVGLSGKTLPGRTLLCYTQERGSSHKQEQPPRCLQASGGDFR